MDSLQALLDKHEIRIGIAWNQGILKEGSQWLVCKSWVFKGKDYFSAAFGDFKTGCDERWQSAPGYTKEEKKEADKQVKEMQELARLEKEAGWKVRAHELCDEWELDSTEGRTGYMDRKLIKELYGARVRQNEHGDPILIVPMWSIEGHLWNLQRIYAQKLSKGDKFFNEGARIDGLFHVLTTSNDVGVVQALEGAKKILICEGFATAASIKEAHPEATTAVVAAFNSGNLQAVAQTLRDAFREVPIVVCADNDAFTIIEGRQVNVGLLKGRRAAGAIAGNISYPVFRGARYSNQKPTDFNDLHAAEGLNAVRDQISHPEKYLTQPKRTAQKAHRKASSRAHSKVLRR